MIADVRQHALADHIVQTLVGHIRINRLDAVAEQHTEMMHLAWLARFEHESDSGAAAGPNQVVVQARRRQQSRHRGPLGINASIRQDQQRCAVLNRRVCGLTEIV